MAPWRPPGRLWKALGDSWRRKWLPGASPSDSWSAPGSSWGRLGVVLGALGPLLGPPGPLLGVILASQGSLFGAFWEVFFGGLAQGLQKSSFSTFLLFFCVLFGSSFWSSLALLAATPAAKRTLKNHEKPLVFFNEFAWVPFLRQVPREQISEHRRTKKIKREKQVEKQPPRREEKCFKHL